MTINLKLHTTPQITIEHLLNLEDGIRLIVPFDDHTLHSELVGGVKWGDIVSSNSKTFEVGGLCFVTISLKATILPNNQICLESDFGKTISIDDNPKVNISRVSGESIINGHLQYCFTITKGVMRSETISFIEKEFPERRWEDVYGECIFLEAQEKPENNSIQTLKDNWEKWGNHDIEFSNYFPLLNQQKEKLKKVYGWSTNTLRSINTAIRKITEVRNPSSHQNIDDSVIMKTDSTIEAMKTIIKGYEKSMGSEEVERRCRQLEEKKCLIESIKEEMNIKTNKEI